MSVSPGNVPVYHATDLKLLDRRLRLAELISRAMASAFALISVIVIATDSEVHEILTIKKKAKFTDMKALVFLVVANGIAAGYSVMQVLRCGVSMVNGSVLLSKSLAWLIFSSDQVMAYMMLAAVGAAAQSGMVAKFSEPELQWMKVCDMYGKFCNQSGGGLGSAVVGWLIMAVVSGISGFNLFRLYDGNKGRKTSGGW